MVERVWARRPSENTTGTRWRVYIYHSAPSETVCPVISSKHKPWAQSWISSIGSGLGLPRLYSTGFRRPVFVSTSTKSNTPLMPNFSADTCTVAQSTRPYAFPDRPNLCRNDIARNRHGTLLRHPILRPTQQHITTLPPLKPPQETSVFGKKRQIYIIFAAKPQQKRRHQHIPKTENMPDRVHRQLRHLLTLLLHHQRLPLLMQVAALGG